MPRTHVVLLVCLGTFLAGCSSPEETPATSPTPSEILPTAAGTATAAAAGPLRSVGQWWQWRLESASTQTIELTTVVAQVGGGSHIVGATDADPAYRAWAYHVIPLGVITDKDLAWTAHGKPVELMRFPLTDGLSWQTSTWMGDVVVTATKASVEGPDGPEDGFKIQANFVGGSAPALRAEWSPVRMQFVRIESMFGSTTPFASAVLVAQGEGKTASTIFEARDLLRWRVAADPNNPGQAQPRSFSPTGQDETILFTCFIGGAPGAYTGTFIAPDRTERGCSMQNGPSESTIRFFLHAVPAASGSWTVGAFTGGQGFVNMEVFGINRV